MWNLIYVPRGAYATKCVIQGAKLHSLRMHMQGNVWHIQFPYQTKPWFSQATLFFGIDDSDLELCSIHGTVHQPKPKPQPNAARKLRGRAFVPLDEWGFSDDQSPGSVSYTSAAVRVCVVNDTEAQHRAPGKYAFLEGVCRPHRLVQRPALGHMALFLALEDCPTTGARGE